MPSHVLIASDVTTHQRTIVLTDPVLMNDRAGKPFMASCIQIDWDNTPGPRTTEDNPFISVKGRAVKANGETGTSTRYLWLTLKEADSYKQACPAWIQELIGQ